MIFETIRKLLCPFNEIERFVPKQGRILDVGCGHGIFSRILAQKSSQRKILGIDPSGYKVNIAQKSSSKLTDLKFQQAYIAEISNQKFNCICILDVLYLLPKEEKAKLLRKTRQLLKNDGILILKEADIGSNLISYLFKIEETIMVNFLKYTYTDHRLLDFSSQKQISNLLKVSGFKNTTIKKLRGIIPYPHLLFIARLK